MLGYLIVHFLRTFPSTYRAWHFRPDYPITGYEELFTTIGQDFWRDGAEQWINCAITVKLSDSSLDAAKAFQAALRIFSAQANGTFYGASGSDSSCDPRKEWKLEKLRISGSADGRVLFRLKKFLSGEMALVARHYRNDLDSVTITRYGGFFTVSRQHYCGD